MYMITFNLRIKGKCIVSLNTKYTDCIIVCKKDLPLTCPTSDADLWRMHPRVSLYLKPGKEAVCPYCSARYIMTDSIDLSTT